MCASPAGSATASAAVTTVTVADAVSFSKLYGTASGHARTTALATRGGSVASLANVTRTMLGVHRWRKWSTS